jgi:hypothetical protein
MGYLLGSTKTAVQGSEAKIKGDRLFQGPNLAHALLPAGIQVQMGPIQTAAPMHAQTAQMNGGVVVMAQGIHHLQSRRAVVADQEDIAASVQGGAGAIGITAAPAAAAPMLRSSLKITP